MRPTSNSHRRQPPEHCLSKVQRVQLKKHIFTFLCMMQISTIKTFIMRMLFYLLTEGENIQPRKALAEVRH